MTREQEAIDLLNEYGMPGVFTKAALAALLSPSPCPTCEGRGWTWEGQGSDLSNQYQEPCDCTDGTVPPLLRWNEEASEPAGRPRP